MRIIKRRTKRLSKLAVHQQQNMVEMVLSYVSLGDLRRRWRQRETPLNPYLDKKFKKFKRIKIPRDKPIRICGSDGGLMVYGVALNEPEPVNTLFQSIKDLPTPKHYTFKGKKRSEYLTRHFTVWAKYSLSPYLSKDYLDDIDAAEQFFKKNELVFQIMSAILGQCAPGVFQQFQMYPLPNGLRRLCGAWLGCAINNGGNNPNQAYVHRDASEALYGYSGLISCGDYRRGGLIIWELEIVLETEPRDVVIFQDAVIHHSNEEAEGNRSLVICFTQENVYSYWNREYNMRLRRKDRKKNI